MNFTKCNVKLVLHSCPQVAFITVETHQLCRLTCKKLIIEESFCIAISETQSLLSTQKIFYKSFLDEINEKQFNAQGRY